MSGLEVIVAALHAGAAAGSSPAAGDAYAELVEALGGLVDDPARWPDRLRGSGADRDERIMAAARRVLALTDPRGNYTVTVEGAEAVQIGDGNLQIATSHGPSAVTMTGPVMCG